MLSERRARAANSTTSLCLAVLLLFAGSGAALAQALRLVPAGYGGGGRFTAVAVDPADPAFTLAGSDVAGFFISRDGGDSFTPKGAGLDGMAVSAFAFDPARPGTFAVQADAGLYLSRDKGRSLVLVSRDLGYPERFFGGCLLLPLGDDLIAATGAKGVFRVSWRDPRPKIVPLPGLEGRKVNSLAAFEGAVYAASGEGAWRLENGRFVALAEGLPEGGLEDMAADPRSGLFGLSRQGGLYRFDPARGSWLLMGEPPAPGSDSPRYGSLALDPSRPGRILVATHPEYWPYALFVSEDGGKSFARLESFSLAPDAPPNWTSSLEAVEAMAFSPDGRTCFVADWWNLWRSDDGGATFRQLHHGLQNTVVNDIARAPAAPGTAGEILLSTADNGLMVSADDGKSWKRSMNGAPDGSVRAARVSPSDPAKRYMLMEPFEPASAPPGMAPITLCKSVDGGAGWTPLSFAIPARSLPGPQADGRPSLLVIDPADDEAVYVGTNGYGLFRVDTARFADDPEGAVANVSETLPEPCLFGAGSLLAFPEKPGYLLAASLGRGIWNSDDGGRFWAPIRSPASFVFTLAADPARPGRILAGLPEKRIMISEDYGLTWRTRELPGDRPDYVAVESAAIGPAENGGPAPLYAGTAAYDMKAADGLYVSLDGGESFARLETDMAPVGVTALSAQPGGALVGYNGLGVFRVEKTAPGAAQ